MEILFNLFEWRRQILDKRERERDRDRQTDRERERERQMLVQQSCYPFNIPLSTILDELDIDLSIFFFSRICVRHLVLSERLD